MSAVPPVILGQPSAAARSAAHLAAAAAPWLTLAKAPLALLASLSSVAAFLAAGGGRPATLGAVAGGVFLLACGAGALNQWQDRRADATMTRTRGRPLPAGRLRPRAALAFAALALSAGLLLLLAAAGVGSTLVGLLAAGWYVLAYPSLKRRSPFAQVAGALAGAAPPAAGWLAAGGDPADPRLAVLCLFLFLWQVPHFWLLLLDREEEYRAAGLPTPRASLGRRGFRRVALAWTAAVAGAGITMAVHGLVASPLLLPALAVASLALAGASWAALASRSPRPRLLLRGVNAYLLLVLLLVAGDALAAAAPEPAACEGGMAAHFPARSARPSSGPSLDHRHAPIGVRVTSIDKQGRNAMEFKLVSAIVRSGKAEEVENRLQAVGVKGITITKVKGWGEYADFWSYGWQVPNVRIEVFTEAHKAQAVAAAIMDTASTGTHGDGIVAILPVERLYRIRSRKEAGRDEV